MTRPGGVRPEVRADVVVLTALDLEYAAVRAHLTGLRSYTDANGTRYETGKTRSGSARVALGLTGQGNLVAAALTTRAVTWFWPKALVFVGVAGGLKDVALGDVVVATRVHAYQGGKAEADGFRPRPVSWPLSHSLDQDARDVNRDTTWARWLTGEPAVHFKPLVSGEVVLNTGDGHVAEMIREYYNDAVAIDMESAGVAEAAHHNGFHETIIVRAVSDLADGTKRDSDAAGWQPRAVANAAAFAVALADRIAAKPPHVGASPYRGLAAFEEQDAELFFGRNDTADELAALVGGRRFVAVVGRSGSGKSSLVHAGLVPRLRGKNWAIAAFRALPGVPAAVSLAGGLVRTGPGSAEARRATDAIASGQLTEVARRALGGASRLLVCVDQFEELQEDTAREMAALLVKLATGPVPVHVVLTVRAGALDVAVHRFGLGEVARNSVFLLGPMTEAGLREAVEGPVRSTGVSFEAGLVARILDAASDAPAVLTLTQFALTRLWDEQDHGLLTHDAYESFGGVTGALATYADQVWTHQLDDTQRDQARRLLVQLVRPESDGAVRRTARGRELAPELIPLARHLATTRLLVTGTDETGDITIDLAHAALATHWQRLRTWLAEERDFRAWQEDLRESLRRAESLRGPRLASAQRWLRTHPHGISSQERDFVTTSRRGQRLRTTAWRGLLTIIVGLLVVAGVSAVNLERRENELADQQRQTAARLLAAESAERSGTDADTAALLSVAAYRTDQKPDVLAHLGGEYLRYRDTDRLVSPGVGQIGGVVVSADGSMAAVTGTHSTALIRMDGDPTVVDRRDWALAVVALSPDGRRMAGATDRGRVEVWENGSVRVLDVGGAGYDRPFALRFDADGKRLLAGRPSGPAVWDVDSETKMTPRPELVAGAEAAREHVWFGPDGDSVIMVAAFEMRLWPLDGGPSIRLAPLPYGATAIVAGNGRTVVTCFEETLVYWRAPEGKEQGRRALGRACPPVYESTMDYSGRFMTASMAWESDKHPRRAVWLLDATKVETAHVVVPEAGDLGVGVLPRLAVTATGARLVSSVGSTMVVTDLTDADFTGLDGWYPGDPLFSPDLRHALTRSEDQTTWYLWNAATGEELTRIVRPTMVPVAFTKDGTHLVARDENREYVEVLEVPSLRVVGGTALPPQMRQLRDQFPRRFNTFCVVDIPDPNQVVIIHAGLAVRLSVRDGALTGRQLQLWTEESELDRLGDIFSCGGRPGRAEFAFDAGGDVEVWNLDSGRRTVLPDTSVGRISSVRFSPDGSRLAVVGFDGSMELWDVDRRERVGDTRRVVGANLGASVTDFVTGNRMVVRGGGVLRVWDLDRDGPIVEVETAALDPTVVGPDGSLMWWGVAGPTRTPLDPARWADHVCRVVGRDLTGAERDALPNGAEAEPVC